MILAKNNDCQKEPANEAIFKKSEPAGWRLLAVWFTLLG